MDHKEFDELVARLANDASRRDALKGLVGGALATVGLASVAEGTEGKGKKAKAQGKKAKAEACIPTGKKCPAPKPRGRSGKKRRKPKQLGCDKCCQRRTSTDTDGQTRCACAPVNSPCTDTRECCSGVCAGTGTARRCQVAT